MMRRFAMAVGSLGLSGVVSLGASAAHAQGVSPYLMARGVPGNSDCTPARATA